MPDTNASNDLEHSLENRSFRDFIEERRSENRWLPLDVAAGLFSSVALQAKVYHDQGRSIYLYPALLQYTSNNEILISPHLIHTYPPDGPDVTCMAPEISRPSNETSSQGGDAGASVYAIGVMLYEATTGKLARLGMQDQTEIVATFPKDLETLLKAALAPDPMTRPNDLEALAQALDHLALRQPTAPPVNQAQVLDSFDIDVSLSETSLLSEPSQGSEEPIRRELAPALPLSDPLSSHPLESVSSKRSADLASYSQEQKLALLKDELESDTRPRYIVNREFMDHGPFNAVELLRQIANHTFVETDILRDEVSGEKKPIKEWSRFFPFVEHAMLHREVAKEKKAILHLEQREKKAGIAKYAGGGAIALLLIAAMLFWFIQAKAAREKQNQFSNDPGTIDLSVQGGLKGSNKPKANSGAGGASNFPGGLSYEAALNVPEDIATEGPVLGDSQLAGAMANGSFVSACGAPQDMKVMVQVAVRAGRTMGVTVTTNPSNSTVASCVDRHVRGMSWPYSSKRNTLRTTY